MPELTERRRLILTGAIGILLLFSLITIGIKASFGAFDGGYEVSGSFAAAGQGMLPGSDVKIRGVNVGEVKRIDLVDNRAVLTLRINDGVQIPVDAEAVIRPKTLFGEKFVDIAPGPNEVAGPFLDDEGVLTNTLGGFELEQVLSDAFPILEAIDPAELAVVIDELANSGAGLGENINRSIVNSSILLDLQVSNDAELRQFLGDLALLSESLERLSPDLIAGAKDLNRALPTISANSDELGQALDDAARLAGLLADLIENNEAFFDTANTLGSDQLQVLFDKRAQLQPVLAAVTDYTEVQVRLFRIEVGDGTLMAAVRGIVSPGALLAKETGGAVTVGQDAPAPAEPTSPDRGSGGLTGDDLARLEDLFAPAPVGVDPDEGDGE